MDRTERFYKIDQILQQRRFAPLSLLMEELGVSRATIKRDLEYLRDRLNAPIAWDREQRGYHYARTTDGDERQPLPGLWFSPAEAHALLSMEHLLSQLQPGLLGPHIEPLRTRIRMLLDQGDHSVSEVIRRIRVLHQASRDVDPEHFGLLAHGLFNRQRLIITHLNRRTDEPLSRQVSPQRLVYYRDNWYLDAWCHLRKAIRSFGVDAIERIEILPNPTKEIPDAKLDEILSAGYGIFAGSEIRIALLAFTRQAAAWVAKEQWHPRQRGWFDEDGRYLLEIPYSNDTELIMDILRYADAVEVLEPPELRVRVRDKLEETLKLYA